MKTIRRIAVWLVLLALAGCNLPQPETAAPSEPGAITKQPASDGTEPLIPTLTAQANPEELLFAEDFEYIGAFRLPGGEDRPQTFAYGGNAMTFNPDGDVDGMDDGFSGSLFVMGHDRIAYGEVPDGNQVAEISIPAPVISRNLEDLNTANFLQDFADVAAGAFTSLEEIPRVGMAYLDRPETGALIHLTWGAHLQGDPEPSQAWFSPDLANSDLQGFWQLGDQIPYSVNGYLFEIPQEWADVYTDGRVLASGRFRDGGMGGMGPSLFAYTPWNSDGSPAANGSQLEVVTLLQYASSLTNESYEGSMTGYQPADEWEGGAWLTMPDGRSAVLFAGTKATGQKTWYGYRNPAGANQVCVDAHVTDYPTCRTADGGLCPEADLAGCCSEETGGCISMRGWWSNRFDAQFILYSPADLAQFAGGGMEPWYPQPYAVIDIDEVLFLSPPDWEEQMLGSGEQRRFRIGDVSFDRANGLLYVLELYADGAKPLVHVWRVGK